MLHLESRMGPKCAEKSVRRYLSLPLLLHERSFELNLGWHDRGLSVSRPVCHGSCSDESWDMATLSCFREYYIQR